LKWFDFISRLACSPHCVEAGPGIFEGHPGGSGLRTEPFFGFQPESLPEQVCLFGLSENSNVYIFQNKSIFRILSSGIILGLKLFMEF